MTQHFLSLMDMEAATLRTLLTRAAELKTMHKTGELYQPLTGKTLAMIFEKSSTRTRVSFEAGMAQLGGSSLFLSPRDMQLGRGEPIEDTARVISRMVDVIVIRANNQTMLETFAAHSSAPVINALTDIYHPCQLLADVQTYIEHRGDIAGRRVAWIGDGNNVCHSWMNAARQLDFTLVVATPAGYAPNADLVAACGAHVALTNDPQAAADQADIIVTDTWASMGQEEEKAERERAFAGFRVDSALMARAKKDAVFMHCLPAYRGFEVTADVIDGPRSVVFQQGHNRLHSARAVIAFLMGVR